MIPLRLVSIVTVRNQFKIISLGCTLRTRKVSTKLFGIVRCPILGKPVRRCAGWLTDMEKKQTELETENK